MTHACAALRRDVYGQDVDVDERALADPSLDGGILLQGMLDSLAVGF